ncbi:MAG: hypothetical protein ISS71_02135 [Phycisphaerae bacterium]|nr:hypothetical protein [Phycisphaerae bacterium]
MTSRLRNANGKTVAAIVLVCVMALLWGRVLLKDKAGPATAVAQELQQLEQVNTQPSQSDKILAVKLNVVEGRHDALTSNMFSTDHWRAFDLGNSAVNISDSQDNLETRHQANLEKIAKTLNLEAMIRDADGKPYQIFVNDAILTVGSVLTVKEGPEQYELTLKEIGENEAVFDWNKTSITLKMTETVEK